MACRRQAFIWRPASPASRQNTTCGSSLAAIDVRSGTAAADGLELRAPRRSAAVAASANRASDAGPTSGLWTRRIDSDDIVQREALSRNGLISATARPQTAVARVAIEGGSAAELSDAEVDDMIATYRWSPSHPTVGPTDGSPGR